MCPVRFVIQSVQGADGLTWRKIGSNISGLLYRGQSYGNTKANRSCFPTNWAHYVPSLAL